MPAPQRGKGGRFVKAGRKKAAKKAAKRPARKASRKKAAGKAQPPAQRIEVEGLGQPVTLTYRRAGKLYSHQFGARARLFCTRDRRFLVIGPVRVRGGQIEG